MTILPDWNSVESTARAGDVLFWVGIFALVILVAAEVGSHKYGKRTAELQSIKLVAQQRGRLLSEEQLSRLTRLLSVAAKPPRPVQVMGLQGDGEAILLAHQLKNAFTTAGFRVTDVEETFLLGSPGEGILVRQRRLGDLGGIAVAGALSKVGLDSRLIEKPDIPDCEIEIFVSHRTYSSP
jgi:hypothetical protein